MPAKITRFTAPLHVATVKKSLEVNFTVSYKDRAMRTLHPLREWREGFEPKVTLAKLAGEMEVTPSHLSEIENGRNDPSLALAAKLSTRTGIPMDQFVRQPEAAQ